MMNPNYKNSIAITGDSITHNFYMTRLDQCWPYQLQLLLQGLGAKVVCRNLALQGDTTTHAITRFSEMTLFDIPKIGIIFCGVNDPGNAIVQATTQANIQTMISNLKASGVPNVIVVSAHYLNFVSGGDTLSTPYASYVPVRSAQQAAALAGGAVFCDLYTFLRNRIVGGQDVQGSFSWHFATQDQHLNPYGAGLVAQSVLATIQAQGWDLNLK